MAEATKILAGFAQGDKSKLPSEFRDSVIVFNNNAKQISLKDTDFIPKSLKELNNDGFISDWALASRKPIYNFSEIADKPNTLEGYGITDAVSTTSEQEIRGEKTFESIVGEYVQAHTLEVTDEMVANAPAYFADEVEFTKLIKVEKIMIGDCLITWDNVNKCVKFSTGVASDSFVSAGGVHK